MPINRRFCLSTMGIKMLGSIMTEFGRTFWLKNSRRILSTMWRRKISRITVWMFGSMEKPWSSPIINHMIDISDSSVTQSIIIWKWEAEGSKLTLMSSCWLRKRRGRQNLSILCSWNGAWCSKLKRIYTSHKILSQ